MTTEMSWSQFEVECQELAEAGRSLFYQFGVGLGFLATVRRDGGPRLHPVCPVLLEGRLLAHIIPSAKRDDLHRDGRYALHSFPTDSNEDAFYVTGHAVAVADPIWPAPRPPSSWPSGTWTPSHPGSATVSSSSS